jgi:hypothetical protein
LSPDNQTYYTITNVKEWYYDISIW